MERKVFLQGNDSKKSTDTSNGLNVELKGKRKLLPIDNVAEVISQYDQYREERENCHTVRLTCQVNPICSNVLFNHITEIVKDEGSDHVAFVNYGLGGDSIFGNTVYKPKTMDFWSSGNMKYQSVDNNVSKLSSNTQLSKIKDTTHDSNGVITSDISHPTNAIRDTQLSKKNVGFVYHCGLDFFNNHLLRSNTFKTICKCPNDNMGEYTAFNTIADLMRTVKGEKVIEKLYFPTTETSLKGNKYTKLLSLHLYEYDDIMSYDNTVKEMRKAKYNGWVGFNNKPKIKSYFQFASNESMEIEKPLAYLNGGDFVDMYPSRDLYSFVPKYNEFQKRIEKNWNYCITYPSSSYTPSDSTEPFGDIIETNDGLNSLKAIYFDENTRADNGISQVVIYGISKHGLSQGDFVNIYKTYDDNGTTVNEKIIDNAEVIDIVDDYIFVVSNSNIAISDKWVYLSDSEKYGGTTITVDGERYQNSNGHYFKKESDILNPNGYKYYIINGQYVNFDDTAQRISYKKVYGDVECDYYIRIFSRFPNFKYASGDTSNEYNVYKDNEKLLKECQDKEHEFESHVSRLAFAKNVYGDEIGEVVFTDDIDIANIHDNLGRPISSLYLTFIKNNKGYKEWYGDDINAINTNYKDIEFSHCFGRLTCGIEVSDEASYDDNIANIHKIGKKSHKGGYSIDFINGDRGDDVDEDELWYGMDKHFYGDLCYYDGYNAIERHIQYVNHRFNTAQREADSSPYFNSYMCDEIEYDDYDSNDSYGIKTNVYDGCNKLYEGYYYEPHYEIPIRSYGKLESVMPTFLTIRKISKNGDGTYTFVSLQQHFLSDGDKAMLYDRANDKYYNLVKVKNANDNYRAFTCKIYDEKTDALSDIDTSDILDYKVFKLDNLDVPSYARVLKDGTCRVIWRNLLNNGFNKSDDTIEEYPFTNNAFYINRKIDIYVRRQDPQGIYGLYDSSDIKGEVTDYTREDNYAKEDEITC